MKTLLLSLALLFALAGCASSNSGMSNFDTNSNTEIFAGEGEV